MDNEIYEMAKNLRLAYFKNNYEEIIKIAEKENLSYGDFIKSILKSELADRLAKSITKHINSANFPNFLTLDQLDMDAFTYEISAKIKETKTLSFLDNGQNIILCGNPGVGKTHIAIGLGILACQQNKSVLFTNVPNLIIELKEKSSTNQLSSFKRKFCSYDLVILDELGYISFDKGASELLFNLLSTRNEHKSLIITTNLSFNRWGEIFGDEVLTAAMVDRLTQCAYVMNIQGQSYRLKKTQTWINSSAVDSKN